MPATISDRACSSISATRPIRPTSRSSPRTALAIQSAGHFAVNILAEDQEEVSQRFARPGQDHFEGLELMALRGLYTSLYGDWADVA